MQEESLEPLPEIESKATLLFGKIEVECQIVTASENEFRVAVPGIERYEGDPRLKIVTKDGTFAVRLTMQVPHADGYSYRLKKVNERVVTRMEVAKRYLPPFSVSQYCAAGLMLAILTGMFCVPLTNDPFPLVMVRGLRRGALGWWSPSIKNSDRVPPGISVDQSLAINKKADRPKHESIRPELNSGELTRAELARKESNGDVKTISVSMISPASPSFSAPSTPLPVPASEAVRENVAPNDESHWNNSTAANVKRPPTLKSLLEDGQVGRIQALTRSVIPWLFQSIKSSERPLIRMSDAAWSDLLQFEMGLRELPGSTSSRAIASLQRTLILASTDNNDARSVYGIRGIFVIASDDANVYFRVVKGTVELVRVLPIDFREAD